MADNPFKSPILTILQNTQGPISEHELIHQLVADGAPFPEAGTDNSLALFQKHFMVMNALYQLQQEMLEQGLYVNISPLAISIESTGSGEIPLPQESSEAKLRDYYLDWSQLSQTGPEEVKELLNHFWLHYLAMDKRGEALKTLGLEGTENWAEIKDCYRRLAARHHPDRGGDSERFMAIREAYEILEHCRPKKPS